MLSEHWTQLKTQYPNSCASYGPFLNCIESLPQNDDIQDYKRNYGEEEVEESVKPENIDVEIPIVGPDHDRVVTF